MNIYELIVSKVSEITTKRLPTKADKLEVMAKRN